MEEDHERTYSFENPNKLDLPLLKTKPHHSRMISQTSMKDPTPGFRTFGQDSASAFPAKADERELELFSEKLRKFIDKLDSLCLPDRIQFVMKTKVINAEETKREFGIHSMDQSLDLENSFFNSDEFAIGFGGSDLLEFSFKKAEGIKMINRPSKSYVKVDSKALEQFKYKSFGVGFSVEGEARRIGIIKKVSGVFLIMDINEVVIYKIQKIGTWNAGYQKVDILDKDDHIIGSLDLVRLSPANLACTIVFPNEASNMERFLIMGTVYILMWKVPPPKTWLNKFDPSTGSYICYIIKKLVSKCIGIGRR